MTLAACAGRPVHARAGQTLITRETFQGVGTLNAAAPGNLGAPTGNFYKRAVGPRLSGDTTAAARGWSADVQGQTSVYHTFSNAAAFPQPGSSGGGSVFCCDWWVYLDADPSDGSDGKNLFYCVPNQVLLRVDTSGSDGRTLVLSAAQVNGSAATVNAYTIALRTWTEFRVTWSQSTGKYYNYQVSLQVRLAGAPGWTEVASYANVQPFANPASVGVGFGQNGGNPPVRGRYGMPSLYSLGSWADRSLLVPDVVDPPAGPFAWYANPATGNDSNDGTSAANAWATVAKINAESANLGMFGRAGYASGDTLTIDTTAANLLLGTASLNINTQGLNVTQVGGGLTGTGEIQAWTTLPNGSFSLVGGATKTYQHTLTENEPSIVPWENDRWLNDITAASFGGSATAYNTGSAVSYANVSAALEAVPGSFWTDGTTLYLHPFGDTNPATDGKTYTRSYNRNSGYSAVMANAPDIHFNGLRVRKTCLCINGSGDPGRARTASRPAAAATARCSLKTATSITGANTPSGTPTTR